jgi:hypothetical protein
MIEIQRMWPGGPLRHFSIEKRQPAGHYIAYSSPILTGWAGAYVCDLCRESSDGLYFARGEQKWLCGAGKTQCRPSASPSHSQNSTCIKLDRCTVINK